MSKTLPPFETVLQTTREIVDEQPEFVYEAANYGKTMCSYTHIEDSGEAVPSCLVAKVLHRHGFTVEELEDFDRRDGGQAIGEIIHDGGVIADEKTHRFLAILQDDQDLGITWGDAYENALHGMGITDGDE